MPRRNRRLVIVANRLPVHRVGTGPRARWASSNGGLVTALAPIMTQGSKRAGIAAGQSGTWVGWTGTAGKSTRTFKSGSLTLQPVPISEREVDAYYNHFSNRTLWPLYHDAIRSPEFDHAYWRPYVAVNERFAQVAAETAEKGDLVWVHDYHLQLVPRMLRALRPDLKIGFFLHIPFPPEELFAWLPWREQILTGILGADVVGFQTHAASQNFVRAAKEFTEAEGSGQELVLDRRAVTIGTYPVSIDFDWFERCAGTEESMKMTRDIRRRVGHGRKILLAVDRLDYTKGIDLRMRAFETLLKGKRLSVNDCVLMQIATPSRESAHDYAEIRSRIEHLVGRINGEHSDPGRVAVHYFRRNLRREELTAYYRAADVMLVTPVRDGMNLVAKEFVATRSDNSGVLVLSEFAGAARQMRKALLVNPRDVEGMARMIDHAVRMPRPEATARMSALRGLVRRDNVYVWAEEFLEALAR